MNAAAAIVPIVPAIKLQRILYATDFSEGSRAALPFVSAIARRYHSEVFVSHIWSPLPHDMVTSEAVSTMENQQESAAKQKLAEFLRLTGEQGISTKSIVKSGNPVEELERIVREQEIDLAVLSTYGRVGLKRLVMGSVAEALFRNLSCPVLTVGPYLAGRFRETVEIHNILFPTDLSVESQAVFPYLASLAHEYNARLTLLHVLPLETENNSDAKAPAEPLRKEMMRIYCPQISPKCEAEFLIDTGDAAEKILALARERNVDLIGLGIRKAEKSTTHFRNTVTYRVLLNAMCPVLTDRFYSYTRSDSQWFPKWEGKRPSPYSALEILSEHHHPGSVWSKNSSASECIEVH
jgi:nucleotide-binding universal stress UspA family protein